MLLLVLVVLVVLVVVSGSGYRGCGGACGGGGEGHLPLSAVQVCMQTTGRPPALQSLHRTLLCTSSPPPPHLTPTSSLPHLSSSSSTHYSSSSPHYSSSSPHSSSHFSSSEKGEGGFIVNKYRISPKYFT